MRGNGSIQVSVRVSVKVRAWLFRICVLGSLSIVPGTVSNVPIGGLAQHPVIERVLTTQVGERQDVRLDNGSNVIVDTDTQAIVYESPGPQRLDLRSGRILVDTVTGHSTPLQTTAGYLEIDATDAQFSLQRLVGGACTVNVFRGAVYALMDGATFQPGMRRGSIVAVKLTSGQGVTVWSDRASFSTFDAATAKRLLSWLNGTLMFKDARLADVIAEFNRYNHERLETADESIGELRIGGNWPANDPQRFAEELLYLGIRHVRAPARDRGEIVIVLTKAPSAPKPHMRKPPKHEPNARIPAEATGSPYNLRRPREGFHAMPL